MNERGDIRELTNDEPEPLQGEIVIRSHTAGILSLMSIRQRRRFYKAFKRTGDERLALNVARSVR